MAVGRKGVVFTLAALVLVGFMVLVLQSSPRSPSAIETAAGSTRVTVMDSYLATFERHAAASLASASYLAFENLTRRIESNGTFLADVNTSLEDCIARNEFAPGRCMDENATFNRSMHALKWLAQSSLNIQTEWVVEEVWVSEERPMEVVVRMNLSYNVSDPVASWQRLHRTVVASVNLEGVRDPLYAYLAFEGATDERRSFSLTPLNRQLFTPQQFAFHYANGSYLPLEGKSPSVLQRYKGEHSAVSACCGIESVVNRSALKGVTSDYANYSMTDHHLAAHLDGSLPEFDCEAEEVRGLSEPGGSGKTLVLAREQFDSIYNLSSVRLAPCTFVP